MDVYARLLKVITYIYIYLHTYIYIFIFIFIYVKHVHGLQNILWVTTVYIDSVCMAYHKHIMRRKRCHEAQMLPHPGHGALQQRHAEIISTKHSQSHN